MTTTTRDRVTLDASFEPLVERFLTNRRSDAEAMRLALTTRDWAALAAIAHAVKGVGGTFGFDRLSEMAAAIERAAARTDADAAAAGLTEIGAYLERVEVAYA